MFSVIYHVYLLQSYYKVYWLVYAECFSINHWTYTHYGVVIQTGMQILEYFLYQSSCAKSSYPKLNELVHMNLHKNCIQIS